MEDSNGYLKKMYEEKIRNYEEQIATLKKKVEEETAEKNRLKSELTKAEDSLESLRREKIGLNELI